MLSSSNRISTGIFLSKEKFSFETKNSVEKSLPKRFSILILSVDLTISQSFFESRMLNCAKICLIFGSLIEE